MTKKSAARLIRDSDNKKNGNILKNNACWDELEGMYNSMCHLLVSHSALSELAKNEVLNSYVVDKDMLSTNLNILSNDLTKMNDDLTQLHNMHAGRTGGTKDPNILMDTIVIFEKYNLFMEMHDAVVMPTAYQLISQFNQAEELMYAAQRTESSLRDVDVVSDIEFVDKKHNVIDVVENTISIEQQALDFEKLTKSFNEVHNEPIKVVLVDVPKTNTLETNEVL